MAMPSADALSVPASVLKTYDHVVCGRSRSSSTLYFCAIADPITSCRTMTSGLAAAIQRACSQIFDCSVRVSDDRPLYTFHWRTFSVVAGSSTGPGATVTVPDICVALPAWSAIVTVAVYVPPWL